jgi:hypothetical protein
LIPGLKKLKDIAKTVGLKLTCGIMSFDGVYNSRKNRKAIFNIGMTPNIPENKGNRKKPKRGRKQTYKPKIFKISSVSNPIRCRAGSLSDKILGFLFRGVGKFLE